MRTGRVIDHTRLWGSTYHGFLEHAFGQISGYFSLPYREHRGQKESSFVDYLSFLSSINGFKPMAVLHRFDRLIVKTPSIARHRQTNKPVLLLPTAHTDYVVINHDGREIGVFSALKISENFDSIIQIFPLMSLLNLLHPSFRVFLWSAIISIMVLVFFVASFVDFGQVHVDNRFSLMLLMLVTAVLALGALGSVKNLALNNYGLAVVLVLHDVFRSLHVFANRDNFIRAYFLSESVLKKYFFDRFKLIIALLFLALTIVLAGVVDYRLMICAMSIYAVLLLSSWAIEAKHKKLQRSKSLASDAVNLMLERVQCSLAMAQGLKALSPLISELDDRHKQFTTASMAAWYMARFQQICFIMFPLLMLVLLVLLFGSGFINLSLWQAALSLLLALLAGFLLAYAGNNLADLCLNRAWAQLPHEQEKPSRHLQLVSIRGKIELINVSFAYKNTGQVIFKGYDLLIEAGSSIAIIGPPGSGKTTLQKIMMGILAPDQGQVIIDGHDIRSLDKHHLRTNFGVVLQGAQLFAGSVFDNIMCGRALPLDSVHNLLLSHEIFDALLDLPLGLSTYVFDRGKNIAHYERCLIVLARALVHKPQLIFIDELVSGLHADAQQAIIEYVTSLDATCIITAQAAIPGHSFTQTIKIHK